MLRLLLVCAVVSIAFDLGFSDAKHRKTAWIEGTAIFLAVFIVAFVGSYNDYKKEEQFLKLQAISEKDNVVTVRRRDPKENKIVEKDVHHNYIEVGDICKINAGMNIAVDGIVLKGSGILTNESAMTGETKEMKKEAIEICLQRQ